MKKLLAALLICAVLLSLCACDRGADETDAESPPDYFLDVTINDDLPLYRIDLTRLEETSSGGRDETVYLARVYKPRSEAELTVHLFTVCSAVEDGRGILDAYDVNFDGYRDLIVRYYQTPHSAAIYRAYRWLPGEGRFEAEPFLEYLCSGEPTMLRKHNLLIARNATSSSVTEVLYRLSDDGRFEELRRRVTEHNNGLHNLVVELRGEERVTLYDKAYDLDEKPSPEEAMRCANLFYFGDEYSYTNYILQFAEDYCWIRASSSGEDGFDGLSEMLDYESDPELYLREQEYAQSARPFAHCTSSMTTGFSLADGSCRVNVAVLVEEAINWPDEQDNFTYHIEHLAIDVHLGFDAPYVCGVSEGVPPALDEGSICDIDYDEDGDVLLYLFDEEHNRPDECSLLSSSYAPAMSFVDSGIIQFRRGAGTGTWLSVYYELASRAASECIMNSYYLDSGVILTLERAGDGTVRAHLRNAFDSELYDHSLPLDLAPVGNPTDALYDVELLDESHLRLHYFDPDWQEITQVFDIPVIN